MQEVASGILLIIEFVCGAASGIALGRWVPSFSIGRAADGLVGGLGGLILVVVLPATRIPGLGRFVGYVGSAADATLRGVGGLTPALLIGAGILGVLGGIVLTVLAGFVKTLIRG